VIPSGWHVVTDHGFVNADERALVTKRDLETGKRGLAESNWRVYVDGDLMGSRFGLVEAMELATEVLNAGTEMAKHPYQ
jgi:hypothetical protein